MAEPEHGTQAGVNWHKRACISLCPACSVFHADYQRGRRIVSSGPKRYTAISAGSLARLLRGDDPATVLAAEYGPYTMTALHELVIGGEER